MEKLGINPIQLAAQVVNVAVLIFVLNKFLYKPVLSMLEKRKEQAKEQENKEKSLAERLGALEKKEKDIIRQAKIKADNLAKQAELDAKKASAALLEDAKKVAEKQRQRILKDAESEAERTKDEFEKLVASKAVKLANDALTTLVGSSVHSKLTESQIVKLAKK